MKKGGKGDHILSNMPDRFIAKKGSDSKLFIFWVLNVWRENLTWWWYLFDKQLLKKKSDWVSVTFLVICKEKEENEKREIEREGKVIKEEK